MKMTIAKIGLIFILASGGSTGSGQDVRPNHHPRHLEDGKLPSLVEDQRINHQEDPWLPPINLISNDHYEQGRLFLQDAYQQSQERSLQEGDYEDCLICGEMSIVTLPDTTVDVPTDGGFIMTLSCEELEEYGNIGNISSILCPLVQPLVQDLCGCEEVETDAPSSSPSSSVEPSNPVTTTETEASTDSGGIVPSTILSFICCIASLLVPIFVTSR
jgi:hypothetical protein